MFPYELTTPNIVISPEAILPLPNLNWIAFTAVVDKYSDVLNVPLPAVAWPSADAVYTDALINPTVFAVALGFSILKKPIMPYLPEALPAGYC